MESHFHTVEKIRRTDEIKKSKKSRFELDSGSDFEYVDNAEQESSSRKDTNESPIILVEKQNLTPKNNTSTVT